MVDTKSKEESISRTTTGVSEAYDTARDNVIRVIDEVAKVQPQYAQSISNLQLDYIQTAKNTIQTVFSVQKQLAGNLNFNVPGTFADQFAKQANDFTSNLIRTVGTNNQLTINALDAARENVKIYSRTVDAITEFNTNVVKAWTSLYSAQQQQFFKQ
jgi:sugar-specific transcriptional regulator TrmB